MILLDDSYSMGDRSGDAAGDPVTAFDRGRGVVERICSQLLSTRGRKEVAVGRFSRLDPDRVAPLRAVAEGACDLGIIVDGAGIGSCMVANKVPGVRAALCYDAATARNSREHNYANVLTLGGRMISEEQMREIVSAWLSTPEGEARHGRRVAKIMAIEKQYLKS